MATKNVKYPGRLGKPMTFRESEAVAMEAMRGVQGGGLAACIAAIDAWEARREGELLRSLLSHYGIAPDDKLRWPRLCLKLAQAHVPAFRSAARVGRPRKLNAQGSLADLLSPHKGKRGRQGAAGKPGRKRKITDGQYRSLLEEVRETCEAEGFKGRGKVTKALTEILSKSARADNESVPACVRRHLSYFQKRYSDAKRRFPELGV